jgi:hypothetical protein
MKKGLPIWVWGGILLIFGIIAVLTGLSEFLTFGMFVVVIIGASIFLPEKWRNIIATPPRGKEITITLPEPVKIKIKEAFQWDIKKHVVNFLRSYPIVPFILQGAIGYGKYILLVPLLVLWLFGITALTAGIASIMGVVATQEGLPGKEMLQGGLWNILVGIMYFLQWVMLPIMHQLVPGKYPEMTWVHYFVASLVVVVFWGWGDLLLQKTKFGIALHEHKYKVIWTITLGSIIGLCVLAVLGGESLLTWVLVGGVILVVVFLDLTLYFLLDKAGQGLRSIASVNKVY